MIAKQNTCSMVRRTAELYLSVQCDDGATRGVHADGDDVRRRHPGFPYRGTHGVTQPVPPVLRVLQRVRARGARTTQEQGNNGMMLQLGNISGASELFRLADGGWYRNLSIDS